MDKERTWLLNEKYNGVESPEFFADIERLKNEEPLAYIIGNMPFYNCTINLDYKPLIPRTETEYWVHEFVSKELNNKTTSILDIFSGSGCIGVAVLKNSPARVDFAEIKPENINQIKQNLELNDIETSRYEIFESDVFKNIPEKKYDYILANPPYISKDRVNTVGDSVIGYEDHLALFAENDGLFFVEKIIKEGKNYLAENGKIYIEYDPWQTPKIIEILKQNNISDFKGFKDQYDRDRFLRFGYK